MSTHWLSLLRGILGKDWDDCLHLAEKSWDRVGHMLSGPVHPVLVGNVAQEELVCQAHAEEPDGGSDIGGSMSICLPG